MALPAGPGSRPPIFANCWPERESHDSVARVAIRPFGRSKSNAVRVSYFRLRGGPPRPFRHGRAVLRRTRCFTPLAAKARRGSLPRRRNLINREEEREVHPLCTDEKIGVLPWSPRAQGRLTRDWDASTKLSHLDDAVACWKRTIFRTRLPVSRPGLPSAARDEMA